MNQQHDGGSGWLFIAMAASVTAVVVGLVSVTAMIGPASIPIWGAVSLFGWLTMRGPVGEAIAVRLGAPQRVQQVEVPEEVYAELDDLRVRMAEMEERQEFSERLLTQRPDTERINSGGDA